jgi:hypothetical protein
MFPKVEILILNNKKNLTPKIFGFFGLGVGLGFWVGFGFFLGFWVWVWVWVKKTQTQPKNPIFFGFG